MNILLIRHARHGNPAKHPDEGDLVEEGVEQAEATARLLLGEGIERLFSSPYPRTMQTASIISRAIGVPVEIRAELQNKVRTGMSAPKMGRIREMFPGSIIPHGFPEEWRVPHPESGSEVYTRMARFVAELVSLETRHERVLVLSHAWPLDALTSMLAGCPPLERMRFYYDNCSLTLVSIKDGVGRLCYVNLVPHVVEKRGVFFY